MISNLIFEWKKFLSEIKMTERDIATQNDMTQPNLNRQINRETIQYSKLYEIVSKHGYTLKIIKDEKPKIKTKEDVILKKIKNILENK